MKKVYRLRNSRFGIGDINRIFNCLFYHLLQLPIWRFFSQLKLSKFGLNLLGDLLGYFCLLKVICQLLVCAKYVTRSRLITVEKSLISNHFYQ
jgi:hypothetical protein